jgi:hypothetical protein
LALFGNNHLQIPPVYNLIGFPNQFRKSKSCFVISVHPQLKSYSESYSGISINCNQVLSEKPSDTSVWQ